jgi:hypothetical protein
VLGLAWARLTYRPGRWLLVALGVAVALAVPVITEASAQALAARAVAYGVGQLDPGERSIIAALSGIAKSPAELARIDATARTQLATLTATPPRAEMLLHRLADRTGATYFFGAVDDLGSGVRITSGRAPTTCTPTRCEVVVLGAGTPTLQNEVGLVVVGRAVRTDPLVLGGDLDPGHDSPVLLADGVSAAAQLAGLSQFQRQYAWIAPIDLNRVAGLGVPAYLDRSAQADDALARDVTGMSLTAPDDVLHHEQARADLSTRRFTLLSGSAVALLLGFAAIGAIGLRRDAVTLAALLRRRGVGRLRLAVLAGLEALAPTMVGVLFAVAAAALAVAAGLTGVTGPRWDAAFTAIHTALPAVGIGALVAFVVIALVRAWPDASRPAAAWRAVDATIVAGLAVAGFAAARGEVTAGSLDTGSDPLLLLLPILAVVCGGLLVARIFPPVTATAARLLPHRWLGSRIGVLGGVRRPLRPVATAGFLAAAIACAVFAVAYRATLDQGATEQAAFTSPLDARVDVGATLVNPLAVGSIADYGALAPGASAHPVLRATASIRRSAAESDAAEVLAVDPTALPAIPAWDHEVGTAAAPGVVAAALATDTPQWTGIAVPPGTTRFALPASGDTDLVVVTAWLRTPDGRDIGLELTPEGDELAATMPPAVAGETFYALGLSQTPHFNTIQQHHFGEGGNGTVVVTGTIHLGPPALPSAGPAAGPDQAPTAGWAGWGSDQAKVQAAGSDLAVTYAFTGDRTIVRAGAAAAQLPVPVIVDPQTAAIAAGGTLQLVIGGNTPIPARIVAVADRFPTMGPRFVVAATTTLAKALDTREPGTGGVTELWLDAPPSSVDALRTALAQPPYDQLALTLRDELRARLAGDPLALGAARLLATDAVIGLAIAAVAVMLLVIAERRDDAAELYAWESDGVTPATLRRSMVARAGAVVALGVPGGIAIGLALTAFTTRLVAVTAVGTAPAPPLSVAFGPGSVGLAVAASVLACLLAAGLVAAVALREPVPRRPEEVLT